jgi:hypothetical protein
MEAKPKSKLEANECDEDSAPPWRFGPAQMWYDQMGLQPNPSNFKYGLKTKVDVFGFSPVYSSKVQLEVGVSNKFFLFLFGVQAIFVPKTKL